MAPRLATAAEASECQAQPEMGIRSGRLDVDELGEGSGGLLWLAAVVVGLPERLEDGRLAGLESGGSLEQDGGLGVMTAAQKGLRPRKEAVGRLALDEMLEFLVLAIGVHGRIVTQIG